MTKIAVHKRRKERVLVYLKKSEFLEEKKNPQQHHLIAICIFRQKNRDWSFCLFLFLENFTYAAGFVLGSIFIMKKQQEVAKSAAVEENLTENFC